MTAADPQTELRTRGYRMTSQRRLVLDAINELEHATPDEILRVVQRASPDVNASTIYRTLDLLEDLGLVTHAHLGHGAPAYHPGAAPPHAHLLCGGCQAVIEVPPDNIACLVDALREQHGFHTDVRHLTVSGRCANCAADPAQP